MYRIAICEDDSCLRTELSGMCRDILKNLNGGIEHEITLFSRAEELKRAVSAGWQFDLLCLDILMPGMSGMELAGEIRLHDEKTSIVFITSSTDFLLDGYEVRPIRYLLKPVKKEKMEEALCTDLRLHHSAQTVTIMAGGKMTTLVLKEILYVESRDHRCVFVLKSGEQFFWMPLSQAEGLLPKEQFARCHNSFLVNLANVVRMDRRGVTLVNGKKLAVSRRCADEFQKKLTRYLNIS